MIINEITEQNIEDFIDPVPALYLNEIKREFVRGLSGEDEGTKELKAAVIFELKNAEEDASLEAEILWFFASDASSGAELLRSLENYPGDGGSDFPEGGGILVPGGGGIFTPGGGGIFTPGGGGIGRVFFELPSLGNAEEEAFALAGYSLERKESRDVLVSVEDFSSLSFFRKKPPEYVKPLSEITSRQFKAAVMSSVFHGRYGLLEDLPFLPITWFDPDISCCVLTDDKVNAMLLVSGKGMGGFRVELLFALQPDANIHLLNMITYSIRAAANIGQPGDKVLLRRHNEASSALVRKLFPGKKGKTAVQGEMRKRQDYERQIINLSS